MLRVLCVMFLVGLLSGCAAAVVGGAAATAGAVHDRRTFGTVIDDNRAELTAYDSLNKDKQLALQNNVEFVAYNGVMLIIGQVADAELKARAESHAQGIEGIRRVVSELEIGPTPSLAQSAHDKWITARLKTALLDIVDLPDFDPSRVNVTTENGVVYLMGLVSHVEAERVVEIVRTTRGVDRVVKVFEYTD
jgi:osmotically-inducible protein OsmY